MVPFINNLIIPMGGLEKSGKETKAGETPEDHDQLD